MKKTIKKMMMKINMTMKMMIMMTRTSCFPMLSKISQQKSVDGGLSSASIQARPAL